MGTNEIVLVLLKASISLICFSWALWVGGQGEVGQMACKVLYKFSFLEEKDSRVLGRSFIINHSMFNSDSSLTLRSSKN